MVVPWVIKRLVEHGLVLRRLITYLLVLFNLWLGGCLHFHFDAVQVKVGPVH